MVQIKIIECLQNYGSCIYILASVYLVILNSQAGFGGTIEPESSNVTVTNGNSLVIKWRVNPSAGEAVLTLYVDVLANTTSTILIGLSPALEPDAIKLFGTGRLSATFMGTTYKLMLKNVTYNDTVKFQLLAVFHKDNFTSKRSVVQVTVNGTPETCGESLKPAYNIIETANLTVTQDICGHPKPDVKWKLEEDSTFSSSFSSVLINNAPRKYRYSFQTREIIRSHCGKKIIYNARNEFGNIEEKSTIYISFKPSKITLRSSYRYNSSCVYLAWYREDTGNCLLTYHLKFDDKDDVYSTFNTNFSLCHSSCASNASVWASYKGNAGYKTSLNVLLIPLRPGTTTMLTDDCQYARKLAIGIFGTMVIGLILNIVVIVILKNKGFIVFTRNPKITSQNTERTDDNNYEVAETTSSHYADLNVKSVATSIYADLTSDPKKEYAEIDLSETKRNMYANINT